MHGTGTGSSRRDMTSLITSDAMDSPLEMTLVDATLDKETLNTNYITRKDVFQYLVKGMGWVKATGGCERPSARPLGQTTCCANSITYLERKSMIGV